MTEIRKMLGRFQWDPEKFEWKIHVWNDDDNDWDSAQEVGLSCAKSRNLFFHMNKNEINYRWIMSSKPTAEELEGKI